VFNSGHRVQSLLLLLMCVWDEVGIVTRNQPDRTAILPLQQVTKIVLNLKIRSAHLLPTPIRKRRKLSPPHYLNLANIKDAAKDCEGLKIFRCVR